MVHGSRLSIITMQHSHLLKLSIAAITERVSLLCPCNHWTSPLGPAVPLIYGRTLSSDCWSECLLVGQTGTCTGIVPISFSYCKASSLKWHPKEPLAIAACLVTPVGNLRYHCLPAVFTNTHNDQRNHMEAC